MIIEFLIVSVNFQVRVRKLNAHIARCFRGGIAFLSSARRIAVIEAEVTAKWPAAFWSGVALVRERKGLI